MPRSYNSQSTILVDDHQIQLFFNGRENSNEDLLMMNYTWRWTLFLIFPAILGISYWLGLFNHFSLINFQNKEQAIAGFIAQHYWSSLLIFMTAYFITVLCMLPITIVLNIAAGYFYGFLVATPLCILCASLGATASMLIFRHLVRNVAPGRYAEQIKKFKQNFKENGINYLLALQLLPVTPFPIINISAGLSDISVWTFFWTTAIGIMPGTIIYTLAGKEFANIKNTDALLSWQVIVLFCLLSLVALLPLLIKYYMKRR